MFGYVIVDKPSLRIREYDYYKATYCGLCHAMGKCTGCVSRLTLSYDMTFFALVRGMIEGTEVELEKKRCIRHPINAVNTVKMNSALEYSAYIGGILTMGKILDDVADEKGAKRFAANCLRIVFSRMGSRSVGHLADVSDEVNKRLGELSSLEKQKIASIDAPAEIFGDIMALTLSHGLEGERHLVAKNVGKRIGRWIYIVDALDDYQRDAESGSYNPFVLLYGGKDFSNDELISISMMLEAELSMALSALELLQDDADKSRSEAIKNILCIGMPASVKRILDKKCKKCNQEKNK